MIDNDAESQKLQTNANETENSNQLKTKLSWRSEIIKRIHILTWIQTYDKSAAISDMIAGTTVGVTMIAQSIAYAALSELPPQYGLYSAFAGTILINFYEL